MKSCSFLLKSPVEFSQMVSIAALIDPLLILADRKLFTLLAMKVTKAITGLKQMINEKYTGEA
jgi:hypothetical protein